MFTDRLPLRRRRRGEAIAPERARPRPCSSWEPARSVDTGDHKGRPWATLARLRRSSNREPTREVHFDQPERFLELLLYTALAGACIPAGAALARIEHIRPQWLEEEFRHFVIAFGGGVLVGAVALVLVPEGVDWLPHPAVAVAVLLLGGIVFMALDRAMAKRRQAAPQFSAMAADFVPESLALGGMCAANAEGAMLLAVLIGLQNLPEGFNAWRELAAGKVRAAKALLLMLVLAALGPVCGVIGWFWLADYRTVVGGVLLFAAGGILYLTFQDIAPQSRLERHWAPPLGAVLGFALALLAHMLLSAW